MNAPRPWSQGSGLSPPELPPRRALGQLTVVVGVLYLVIYGGAALAGFEKKFENPLLSVATSAVLMLLLVLLFVGRDPKWRESLALKLRAPYDAVLFGVVGFFGAYGMNIVLGLGYYVVLKLVGGHPEKLASSKAQWATQLGQLPLWALFPVAALAGFWEEIVFRGFVLGRARAWLGASLKDPFQRDAAAVLFASALFGLGHGYQGAFGLIQTGLVGVVFGTLTLWRRSVWPAVFAHICIDEFGLIMLHVFKPMLEQMLKSVKP